METMLLTPKHFDAWAPAPFQRPLRINDKVQALAEELRLEGGIIPGVLTLGTIKGGKDIYVIDGQHRIEAAKISGLPEFIADVRVCDFDSLGQMGEEFVNLQLHLVSMRPDDILRGLEGTVPVLGLIRKQCPFIGYDFIRRSTTSATVGMAVAIKCWRGSAQPTPGMQFGSAVAIVRSMDVETANEMIKFFTVARNAWGNELQNARLWSALNLTLCMWLWRESVINRERGGNKRHIILSPAQFQKCLQSLSADPIYIDWLFGRHMGERDRGVCYAKIKKIFALRIGVDMPKASIKLPQPAWAT